MSSPITQLRLAFSFITTLPAGAFSETVPDAELGRAQAWFPLVGLLLGLLLLAAWFLLAPWLAPTIVAVLLLGLHFLLTGGFHLDGVADVTDGLMCGRLDTEKIFAIMKDSYLGSMGAVALVLLLLLKFAALTALLEAGRPGAVLLFPVLGRYAIVQLTFSCDYARPEGGLGALFTGFCGRREIGLALGTALVAGLFAAGGRGLVAVAAVALYTGAVSFYARRRFGGVTGDFLGFVCETGEALALLVLAVGLG